MSANKVDYEKEVRDASERIEAMKAWERPVESISSIFDGEE